MLTPQLVHLLFVWGITLYSLHFLLATYIAQPFVYVVHLGYPPLLLMMALQGPLLLARSRPWIWYAPMLLLMLVAAAGIPFAANMGLAKTTFQYFLLYYVLAVATTVFVKHARQAVFILIALVGQFAYYAVFAGTKGLVPWHPTLANYDGFGGLMVMGAGICYWFGAACRTKKAKFAMYAMAAYCVIGVVTSFARGAFLALVAVGFWVWVRSPRKMATAVAGVVAAAVVVLAATVFLEPGFFYNEIMSVFEEGTSEGTGSQRWELWQVGFKVWFANPIIGAGGGNFGAFAAGHFSPGELAAFPNPNVLYGYNLHNAYMQILSEYGIVGMVAFCWCLWDFHSRNKVLKQPAAVAAWAARSGGRFNLHYLALGLEAANIANLLNGMFYASLLSPWFYTVWIANRMLWYFSRTQPVARPSGAPQQAPSLQRINQPAPVQASRQEFGWIGRPRRP